MNRKRLLVYSALWAPREGGAERQLTSLATELSTMGWAIEVVTGVPSCGHEVGDPIRVHRPPTRHSQEQDWQAVAGLRLATHGIRRGLEMRSDVILASLVSASTVAAVITGRLTRTPVVLRLGGLDFQRLTQTRRGRAQADFILSGVSLVVVNAMHLRDQLGDFSRADRIPVQCIPNGVDFPAHSVGGSTQTGDKRARGARVIYYTNGGPAKNDVGFAEIVKALPAVQFRAVGRTEGLPRTLGNLEIRGWRDNVVTELDWADVVMNTSHTEGSPNFCLQGLALGKPVVGYRNGGLASLAEAYPEAVFMANHGDVEAISQLVAVARLANFDRPNVPSIGQAAAEWHSALLSVVEKGHG